MSTGIFILAAVFVCGYIVGRLESCRLVSQFRSRDRARRSDVR